MELKTKVALEQIYDLFLGGTIFADEAYFRLRSISFSVLESIEVTENLIDAKEDEELEMRLNIEIDEWWHYLDIPITRVPPKFFMNSVHGKMSVHENLGDMKW